MRTGVYFCNCGTIISDLIDSERVRANVLEPGHGAYFKTHGLLCSEDGKQFLENDLRQERPDRAVIAACSPREHEKTFMRVLTAAGVNPYLFQMVNIREQVAWVTPDRDRATEKATRLIRAAMARSVRQEPLEKKELDINPDVIVIGAGPAGLKAALTIAEAGRKAVLVEKSPVLGGLPVRFEEISPTMECGPCMLEPMLGEVLHGEHAASIEILTSSEVADVVGSYGNFSVKIRQAARHVDLGRCIGCGECVTPCPADTDSGLDPGLGKRKAMDFAFPGALPSAPYLDPEACLRSRGEDCRACKEACVVDQEVINFDETERVLERSAGAVILAVGSSLYDCRRMPNLGYGTIPDVRTSLEFERLMASNGPSAGELTTSGGRAPETIAIIHCAGSLDKNHKEYCSGVCCEYAFKFSHMISKKSADARIVHFYKELVMPGKDGFSLYKKAKENPKASWIRYDDISALNISSARGRPDISYTDSAGRSGEVAADMVVLCPPIVPSGASERLGDLFEVSRDGSGFFEELHGKVDSARSKIKGVYLAGTCRAPMDIQKAVDQGMAAAGYVLSGLIPGRKLELEPITASVDEERCSGCRVCVSVCPYKAISLDSAKEAASVNAALCQGCGTCVAACPAAAIKGNHFTNEELVAEMEGVLR